MNLKHKCSSFLLHIHSGESKAVLICIYSQWINHLLNPSVYDFDDIFCAEEEFSWLVKPKEAIMGKAEVCERRIKSKCIMRAIWK